MDFKNQSINALTNHTFHCECGKDHLAAIKAIEIGKGVLNKLPAILKKQTKKDGSPLSTQDTVLLVADKNTWKIAGDEVDALVSRAGFQTRQYIFDIDKMHAEDRYVTVVRDQIDDTTALVIAIGSGTINDICRYATFKEGIPYYIIGTAPSMDGYASSVSPLITHNIKKTFSAVCPEVIIGDTDLLATAPDIMIAAGFGDIIGKYLAINDWKISRIINAEYYCPDVADLVLETVQKCVNAVPGLAKRDPQALQYLMESLVLSGIAISFVGYSRPASGSEHHISHFLEMSAVFDGQYGQLHGSCVGMATCLISSMYQQLLEKPWDYARARRHAESFDYTAWESETNRVFGKASDAVITLYGKTHQNDPLNVLARIDQIEKNEEAIRHLIQNVVDQTARTPEYLKTLGGLTDPNAFIAGGERFRDILLHAKDLRDRYAALQMFYDLDELDGLVDSIIQQYYQ